MAKRGPKPKKVDPELVKELATEGKVQRKIIENAPFSRSTYYRRKAENREICDAYEKGREEWQAKVSKDLAPKVLSAFEQLIAERNPAAVIYGMKAVLGFLEQMNINHSVNKEAVDPERLKTLEEKRKALQDAEIDAEFEKE